MGNGLKGYSQNRHFFRKNSGGNLQLLSGTKF